MGGLDAEESHDLADPDRFKEGVSLDESTDALARVSHRFPPPRAGPHRHRGYAGCFVVTPDWHPILDTGSVRRAFTVGFSGHGFKLSPAVGHMMAALIIEGPGAHPDLATFRFSRFAGANRSGAPTVTG